MKCIILVATILAFAAPATFANDWGNKSNIKVRSSSSSYSESSSRSTANNNGNTQSTNFRDRLQAPGFGVGGGYCSDGLSVSFPGGGFGFSSMVRVCKTEIGARVAKTYLGPSAAAQYVCQQPEYRSLAACRR